MERFWNKVDKTNGCWLWTAALTEHGYGKITFRGRVQVAHRVSWILNKGEIPDGLLVLHKCDVPGCVRPAHLFLGTHADNTRDMMLKERCGLTKRTSAEVEQIRKEYAAGGVTMKELATRYDMSKGGIEKILYRTRRAV